MQQDQTEDPDWSVILTVYSDEKGGLIECLLAFKWGRKTGEKNDVFDFFTFLKGASV